VTRNGTHPPRRRDEPTGAGADAFARLYERPLPFSLEAEMGLLGSMIIGPQIIGEVQPILADDVNAFYDERHAAIYQALIDTFDRRPDADLIEIVQVLRDRGHDSDSRMSEYLTQLAQETPSPLGGPKYARMVADLHRRRRLIEVCDETIHETLNSSSLDDGADLIDKAEARVFGLRGDDAGANAPASLGDLLDQELARIQNAEGAEPGTMTGFYDLDKLTAGLHPGEMVVIAARPSMGKAQPLDAKILTPNGFVPMRSMRLGDEVIGGDGKPCRVVGVFPQGEKPVFRVMFADGGHAECCDDHLWATTTRNERRCGGVPKVRTLKEIRSTLERSGGGPNHKVQWVGAVEFAPSGHRPIDAYTLGVWLGDGCRGRQAKFSNPEPDIQDRVGASMPATDELSVRGDGITLTVRRRERTPTKRSVFVGQLEAMGLANLESHQRFVPRPYLFAPPAARLAMLRGILDTDGFVTEGQPCVEYTTTSAMLAQDVRFLAWSLGGWCSLSLKETSYRHKGEKLAGRIAYRMVIGFMNGTVPVSSAKHLAKIGARERGTGRAIVSVEPVGTKPCQCIAVDREDGLYVTDDFVVTHNTALMLNLAEQLAGSGAAGIFSLEMSKAALTQRMLSAHSGVDSQSIRAGKTTAADMARIEASSRSLRDMPILIDDSSNPNLLTLRSSARRMVAQHGARVILIDYLQLLSAPGMAKGDGRQVEVSAISRGIKSLAKELNVPVVVLSQLNRASENRQGNRPRMSDLRESGSIEQDADVVLLLHREDYYHRDDQVWRDANPDRINTAELIVEKQRNGPTGVVWLHWDPRTTRFRNHAGTGSGSAYSAPTGQRAMFPGYDDGGLPS
jgi:replicative DNA helicase